MDSNKSDIDSTRKLIEFYENIEKLCCSEEISAKELSHIIYESVKILSKKNGVKPDHRLKFFHDFSNYEGEFNDKQVKRLFYETFRKAHLSLLQSINNAQPITEDFSERNQDASDFLPTAADFRDNSNAPNTFTSNCLCNSSIGIFCIGPATTQPAQLIIVSTD